jgi:Cof subfamily protein (haloacid dehalogenase superfamily)
VDDPARLARLREAFHSQPPRLVATDLDGTLLRSDGMPSARTVAAVAAAEGQGIDVVLVTARPPRWLDHLASVAGAHGIAVCGNGAFVYDIGARDVVTTRPLLPELVATLRLDIAQAVPGVIFAAERADGALVEAGFPDSDTAGTLPTDRVHAEETGPWRDDGVGKLLAVAPHWDDAEFLDLVTRVVGDRAHVEFSGAAGLAEITAPGVTKARALADWCHRWGVDRRAVWAFGDMPNDLSMLAWAGESFAVANAHPDVLATARHTCPSNDDDGVAQVLEWVVATMARAQGG